MAISMKLVASELLMCGLKNLPVVGTAVEMVEGIRSRHELLTYADRLTATEEKLTRLEKRLRDLVEEEIRTALDNLSRPNLDGPTLTKEIRNLKAIRAQGWEPTLFEGLLVNSSHWEELRLNPQNYGRILSDNDAVSRDSIPVLFEADSTSVLELTPYAFSQLLAGQAVGTPKAEVVSAQDVWALPVVQKPIRDPNLDERIEGFMKNSRDREGEGFTPKVRQYHDCLAAAVCSLKGQELTTDKIKEIVKQFLEPKDAQWVSPSDHCRNHICKGACDCAKTDRAIFDRVKRGKYRVL